MGKVYIAKGGNLYKFGNSENPDERLKQLQTGSPVPLELVYTFDARMPKRAETALKREFAAKHSHGEWFRLNEADILSVKQATTPMPPQASAAPQQPVGATTGALKALTDLWAYRYYLFLSCLLAIPLLLWLESRGEYVEGFIWTEATAQPAAQSVQQPVAPPLPVPTTVPVALPPVGGPVPAVVEEPHISDLVPIPTEQWPTMDAAMYQPTVQPTMFIPVTWPVPEKALIQEAAATIQVQLDEAGYKPLDVPIITPQGYVGP